jgi:hypothetical protein
LKTDICFRLSFVNLILVRNFRELLARLGAHLMSKTKKKSQVGSRESREKKDGIGSREKETEKALVTHAR